ncbi:MAG: lipid-A-disaccharide synthase, partial [Parvibaculales bacterium]
MMPMWAVMAERHIMLVAGEVSGDALGADLIEALRAQSDVPLTISGVGGAQMNAQNFTSIFPMRDIAVMGLGAILPRLPFLLKRLDQTVQYALAQKPDIMV